MMTLPLIIPFCFRFGFHYLLLILSLGTLSSCSLFLPVKPDVPEKYRLSSVPSYLPSKAKKPITILVITPDTRPMYNTTRMAYTIKPYQIAYFSRNEWAETPAQMFKPLIVQTLEHTGYFKAVVTPPYGGRADYVLSTEISELNQNFSSRIPHLTMTVRAQLLRSATNNIIAAKRFSITLPIPYASPYGGVFAANRASSIILREIAIFCLEKIP